MTSKEHFRNGRERPTAVVGRVDMSASGPGASAAPASTNLVDRRADPAHGLVSVPCACGGMVTADPIQPAKGVQAHNYTSRHRGWRANREDGTEPWVVAA